MKTVNAKLYALKYRLIKMLTKSIEADNEALKNGATTTFANFANIKVVECTRKDYTKEDKAILDEIAQREGIFKVVTTYRRIDIDNIDNTIDLKATQVFNKLQNDNDLLVAKAASKVVKAASKTTK